MSIQDDVRSEEVTIGGPVLRGLRHRSRAIRLIEQYAMVLIIAFMVILFSAIEPDTFASWQNIRTILTTETMPACVALAALIPLVVGEFDLSLGYTLGFTSVVGARLAGNNHSLAAMVGVMLLLGLVVGFVNGFLTVVLRINSFIATLAVGIALSGASEGVSGGQVLYEGIPRGLLSFGQHTLLGIVYPFWVVVLAVLVLWYLLEWTPFGRELYAVGGSVPVARLAGIRTGALKIVAFMMAGFLSALGGLFVVAQTGSANPSFGAETLLPAFAAVFLGVTAFRRGTYNVRGTAVAVLLVAVGVSGLQLAGAPTWIEPIFNGVVLLIAVLMSRAEVGAVEAR